MLTQQASLGVQIPVGDLLNLCGKIEYLMREQHMMSNDLCHLSTSECQLRGHTRGREVKIKPPTIPYPALHPRILGLVEDVHGGFSMQEACGQPILHNVTSPSRLIRENHASGHTRGRGLCGEIPQSIVKEPS